MTGRGGIGSGGSNFDFTLSFLVDKMIAEPESVAELTASFDRGDAELAGLIALAQEIRSLPEPQPRAAWMKATKERLMNAPKSPEKRRGIQFLPAMMLPARYLVPTLPRLAAQPLVYKAMIALTVAITATSGLPAVRQRGFPASHWIAGPTQVQLPKNELARADAATGAQEFRQLAWASAHGNSVSSDQAATAAAELRAAELAAQGDDGTEPEVDTVLAELNGLEFLLQGIVSNVGDGSVQVGSARIALPPAADASPTVGEQVQVKVVVQPNGQLAALSVTPIGQASGAALSQKPQAGSSGTSVASSSTLTSNGTGATSAISETGPSAATTAGGMASSAGELNQSGTTAASTGTSGQTPTVGSASQVASVGTSAMPASGTQSDGSSQTVTQSDGGSVGDASTVSTSSSDAVSATAASGTLTTVSGSASQSGNGLVENSDAATNAPSPATHNGSDSHADGRANGVPGQERRLEASVAQATASALQLTSSSASPQASAASAAATLSVGPRPPASSAAPAPAPAAPPTPTAHSGRTLALAVPPTLASPPAGAGSPAPAPVAPPAPAAPARPAAPAAPASSSGHASAPAGPHEATTGAPSGRGHDERSGKGRS